MQDPSGRVAVVTGPTHGIGREIARELARRGALVVLAGRDRAKLDLTRAEIGGVSETVQLDLARFASVREAAEEIRRRHPAVHLLVNNAGIHTAKRATTEDGHETTFQTNHLGHFLLTRELLPALARGAPSRVVNVASEAHRYTRALDLPFLRGEKRWSGVKAYNQSKLANVLFTRELARRCADRGVSAFAAHPGSVRTGWARGKESGLLRAAVWLATPFLVTAEEGAKTPLAACLRDDVASGSYLLKERVVWPTRAAQNDEDARALWEESERLVS